VDNIGAILTFAVFGTLISSWVVSNTLLFASRSGVPLGLEPERRGVCCHLFGALISATDPVATMALLGGTRIRADPLVKSLINGESVLNDAVAIVLFKSLREHLDGEEPALFTPTVLGHFFLVSVGSLIFGIIAGCSCSWFFCHARYLEIFPDFEIAIMCLCAYLTFALSQLLGLSGIVALFFFGIILAHYNWYNLSEPAKVASKVGFKTLASVAESSVFIYLGVVAALALGRFHWNFNLVTVAIIVMAVARAAHVFPLAALLNLQRHQNISMNMQVFMWFSGLRGAIAFALSLSLPCSAGSPVRRGKPECVNSDLFLTTTICIVVLTTVVVGCSVERVAMLLRVVDSQPGLSLLDDSLSVPLACTDSLEHDDASTEAPAGRWTPLSPGGATESDESDGQSLSPRSLHHQGHDLLRQGSLSSKLPGTPRPPTMRQIAPHGGTARGLVYEAFSRFDARVLRPMFGGPSTQVLRGSGAYGTESSELPSLQFFIEQPAMQRQLLEEEPPNVSRSAIFE